MTSYALNSSKNNMMIYDIVTIVLYFVATIFIVFAVLRYFAKESKLHWGVYITMFLTYLTLFSSLALITIDLAAGLYSKRKLPDGAKNEPDRYMIILWQIMYWTIQVLAWIVIPVSQSFAFSAEFQLHRKLLASIIENIVLYAIMAVVGGIALVGLVIYILRYNATNADQIVLNFNMILGVGQSLSNAYGLLLLILLLGYGIVEFPRYMWRQANLNGNLADYESKAARLYFDESEAEDKMKRKLGQVRQLDMNTPENHRMRRDVDRIVKHWEKEMEENNIGSIDSSRSKDTVSIDDMSKKKLVALHKTVINAVSDYHRINYQWKYLQTKAFFLEDVIKSVRSKNERRIVSSVRKSRVGWLANLLNFPEWLYYAYIRGIALRIFALLFVPISLIILYSEFTPLFLSVVKKQIDLSVISLMLRSMSQFRPLLQIVALIWVVIIAFVTLFALFRVRLYSWYALVPHHSDVKSLLYTAVFLCRVVPTLCYNFLQLVGVRVDDGVAFYKVMGPLRLDGLKGIFGRVGYLEILGSGFTNFFPIVMVIVSLLSLLNVWSRLDATLFARVDEKDIEEGRSILQREKRMRVNEMQVESSLHDEEDSFGSLAVTPSRSYGEDKTSSTLPTKIGNSWRKPQTGESSKKLRREAYYNL